MTYPIEILDDEVLLELDLDIAPGDPGCYSGPPEDCYPASGPEVEITGATCDGVALTPAQAYDLIRWHDGGFDGLDCAALNAMPDWGSRSGDEP